MSSGLFKAIELWSAPGADGDDEHDPSALTVLRLPQIDDQEAIAIGSYNGLLKIYLPDKGQFYSSQLLFETQLKQAILGLHGGPFNITSAGSTSPPTLAVLHPKSVAFYDVQVGAPLGEDTIRTAKVQLIHNYDFEESAANVIFGRFQGVRSACDGVCVQSLSGELLFWEQDAFSFKTQLPDVLVAGPLCFVPSNDTMVTSTASGTIEAFKYIALAAQTDTDKIKPTWSLNLGELAMDIQYALSTTPTVIVLGERSVFWLTDSGGLRLSKRLESDPMCMLSYQSNGPAVNLLLSTRDHKLVVLRDAVVVWTAHLDFIPIALGLCEFGGTHGVIVSLEETGRVGCFYLGTDPEIPTRVVPEAQEVAYDRMDAEMAELQGTIRSILLAEPKVASSGGLEMECSLPSIQKHPDGAWTLTSTLTIQCLDVNRIDNVTLRVTAAAPFVTTPQQTVFDVTSVLTVPVSVSCPADTEWVCYSTTVQILATYTIAGEPRLVSDSFPIPLTLLCSPVDMESLDPSSAKVCSVQIQVVPGRGRSLPSLTTVASKIFEGTPVTGDFLCVTGPDGFEVHASRTDDGYCLSADVLGSVWLLLDGFVLVAEEKLGQEGDAVVVNEDLDNMLDLYFSDIDAHFAVRHEVEHYITLLDKSAQQIRVAQKRLLARLKDKTPAPLDHLDQLLEGSYDALLELTTVLADAETRLTSAADVLAASTKTILILLKLRFRLDPMQVNILHSVLDPDTVHAAEDGWEERADAALVHLLKTCLSGTQTDSSRVVDFTLAAPEVGTAPLKKHLTQLCAKLKGGATLALT